MRLTSRWAPRGRGLRSLAPLAALALLFAALGGCSDKRVTIVPPPAASWTRLTEASFENPYYPDWRGDTVAFCSTISGVFHIAAVAADGSGGKTYSGTAGRNDIAPRYINDRLLVFWSNRSGNYDIWYRDLADGSVRRLTTASTAEVAPAPRPGKPGLVYCEAGSSTLDGRIVLIPDTASVPLETRYLTPDTLLAGEPDWNPTGTRVAFSAMDPDSTRHIWVVTLGASDTSLVKLTTGPFQDLSPRWSPDGARIAFTSDRTGRYGVWVVDPAGEAQGLRLISFDDTGAVLDTPCWSPDGRSLVVSSSGRGGRALWILRDLGL